MENSSVKLIIIKLIFIFMAQSISSLENSNVTELSIKDDVNKELLNSEDTAKLTEVPTTMLHNNTAAFLNDTNSNSTAVTPTITVVNGDDKKLLKKAFIISSYEDDSESATSNNDSVSDGGSSNNYGLWVPSRRVYKGKDTKIKHYPFVVSIHLMGKYSCVGSIIKAELVITACSCVQLLWNNRFYRENPRAISVRVGSTYFGGGGHVEYISEVFFHPGYNPKTLNHNLAILKLSHSLYIKSKFVRRIKIGRAGTLGPYTEGVTLLGWGAKTESNKLEYPLHNRLSFADVHLYSFPDCQKIYHKRYVLQNHFCVGFHSRPGGACNGDVGAPAVVDDELVGVVSFAAPSCGVEDSPTVLTNLLRYRGWIRRIKKESLNRYPKRLSSSSLDVSDHSSDAKSNEYSEEIGGKSEPEPINEAPINDSEPHTTEQSLFQPIKPEELRELETSTEVTTVLDLRTVATESRTIKEKETTRVAIEHILTKLLNNDELLEVLSRNASIADNKDDMEMTRLVHKTTKEKSEVTPFADQQFGLHEKGNYDAGTTGVKRFSTVRHAARIRYTTDSDNENVRYKGRSSEFMSDSEGLFI